MTHMHSLGYTQLVCALFLGLAPAFANDASSVQNTTTEFSSQLSANLDFATPNTPLAGDWQSSTLYASPRYTSQPSILQNLGLLGGTVAGGVAGGMLGGWIGGNNCKDNEGFSCLGNALLGGYVGYHLGSQLSLHGVAKWQNRDIPIWAPIVYSIGHQVIAFSMVGAVNEDVGLGFFFLNPIFMFGGAILHERTGVAMHPTVNLNPRGEWVPGLQVAGSF
jgi:hypothetical protein